MIKFIKILFLVLISSLYLFPIKLPVPGLAINTKMILAVLGAALFVLDIIRDKTPAVSKDFIVLCTICAVISIWAFGVTFQNVESDYEFTTYILSVWVWLGAAYAIVWFMRAAHGEATLEIIGNYLVGVCVFQCILAYLMSFYPSLDRFIVSLMNETDNVRLEGRLYGFGAALDPAGLRFSGVLVILSWLIAKTDYSSAPWKVVAYQVSFFLISVIGNMIARTTTVGMVIGLMFLLITSVKGTNESNSKVILSYSIPLFVILLAIIIWLYRVSPSFRDNIRFGFEGFFSLVEKGRWEVHSNDVLRNMIIWPESLKTWLIGDGFFTNQFGTSDRYGQALTGYYMHTDIGYLRYIFYFGVIGLIGMIALFVQMVVTCCRNLEKYVPLFILLLLVNLIGWLKVSSDIIMVFAPFLILSYRKDLEGKCTSSTT